MNILLTILFIIISYLIVTVIEFLNIRRKHEFLISKGFIYSLNRISSNSDYSFTYYHGTFDIEINEIDVLKMSYAKLKKKYNNMKDVDENDE